MKKFKLIKIILAFGFILILSMSCNKNEGEEAFEQSKIVFEWYVKGHPFVTTEYVEDKPVLAEKKEYLEHIKQSGFFTSRFEERLSTALNSCEERGQAVIDENFDHFDCQEIDPIVYSRTIDTILSLEMVPDSKMMEGEVISIEVLLLGGNKRFGGSSEEQLKIFFKKKENQFLVDEIHSVEIGDLISTL